MHAIAINWATMTFPLVMLYLQIIFIDRLIDRLGPEGLVLSSLLLELENFSLNVKKGHTEFWGNLQCYTAPYM